MGRARGQSLILVLAILLVIPLLGLMFLRLVVGDIDFVTRREGMVTADLLAQSGMEYALFMLNHGDWLDRPRPFRYDGVVGSGRFRVTVSGDRSSNVLTVVSEGMGQCRGKCRYTAQVSNPANMTGFAMCVGNHDVQAGRPKPAVVQIGSEGVAANSVTQEVLRIPDSGAVMVGGGRDPHFGGVVVGSDYVIDENGSALTRDSVGPVSAGHYVISYADGRIVFSASDQGRCVYVIYDYLRTVPLPPSQLVVKLADDPVRELSERVHDCNGRQFQHSSIFPDTQGGYFIDYDRASLRLSGFDAGASLRTTFSLLGTRISGPVHVNGDIEWCHLNRLYMIEGRDDVISVTGEFRYAPGSRVQIMTEKHSVTDVRAANLMPRSYRDAAPSVPIPLVGLAWLRRQADPARGGDGLYIDNSQDVEREVIGPTGSGDRTNWAGQALYREWQGTEGRYWENGVFHAPGRMLDLTSLAEEEARNGLIFAEGNLRLKGRVPAGRRLTIVSANNIYIEGSIWSSEPDSSVAIVAERSICINLSELDPVGAEGVSLGMYVNAAVVARTGTLAVIPGGATNSELLFNGAIYMNEVYPNIEWAKAFASITYLYDPGLRRSGTSPRFLASLLRMQRTN